MVNSPDAVEALLRDKGIRYIPSGRDVLINCLNPEHPDKNPSLRIDRVFGYGQCFSCGFKLNIFSYFGITNNLISIKVAALKEKILEIFSAQVGLEMPVGWVPFNEDFRGIPRDVLREYGAFHFPTTVNKDFENRIAFPLKDIEGKISAFVGRHLLSNASPRYLIHPRKAHIPLFPSRFNHNNGSLVLVEGIFDFLNLVSKGLTNVEALMGVNTLGGKKGLNEDIVRLLKFKGVSKIILLFDGDEAGITQAEKYKPLLEAASFLVEVIDLPEDTDPGDLSVPDVNRLREMIK